MTDAEKANNDGAEHGNNGEPQGMIELKSKSKYQQLQKQKVYERALKAKIRRARREAKMERLMPEDEEHGEGHSEEGEEEKKRTEVNCAFFEELVESEKEHEEKFGLSLDEFWINND